VQARYKPTNALKVPITQEKSRNFTVETHRCKKALNLILVLRSQPLSSTI
jgi:hypothetical protein